MTLFQPKATHWQTGTQARTQILTIASKYLQIHSIVGIDWLMFSVVALNNLTLDLINIAMVVHNLDSNQNEMALFGKCFECVPCP